MLDEKTRALLGDREAQQRFTEKGMALDCPCCGGKADFGEDTGNQKGFVQCVDCELTIESTSKSAAIAEWNDRAPSRCTYMRNDIVCFLPVRIS